MILKKDIFAFCFCLIVMYPLLGQVAECVVEEAQLDSINLVFSNIAHGEKTQMDYDSSKSTFVFRACTEDRLQKTYKLIITDIHPEGIFPIEQEGQFHIKLISRCSGNVFIETTHRGEILHSKSTNKVVLGGYSPESRKEVKKICDILKRAVRNCVAKKEPDDSGRIPLPVIKN